MSGVLAQWFFRSLVGGFIIALPIIGNLFILGIALLSIWSYTSNPNFLKYIWLWDDQEMAPLLVDENGLIVLLLILGVGFAIGYFTGDNFKKRFNPLWRRLRELRLRIPRVQLKIPKIFKRKKNQYKLYYEE